MKKPRVLRVLNSLSDSELTQFQAYLSSSLFNSNSSVTAYFSALKKEVLDKGLTALSDESLERIFASVFPGNPYSKSKTSRLNNFLVTHAFDFLGLLEYRSNSEIKSVYSLAGLNRRGLPDVYESLQKKSIHRLDQAPGQVQSYYARFMLLGENAKHRIIRTRRQDTEIITPVLEALDDFYILEKLRYTCAVMNVEQVGGKHAEKLEIPWNVIEGRKDVSPLIRAYAHVYRILLGEQPDDHYRQLKTLLASEREHFGPNENLDLYGHALNHCIRSHNKGKAAYGKELADQYIDGLDEAKGALLLTEGRLHAFHFKNIVRHLLSMQQYARAEGVIARHGPDLLNDEFGIARKFARAQLAFAQRDFEAALRWVREVLEDRGDVYYDLDGRLLELKCLYEMEDYPAAEFRTEALRVLLTRSRFLDRAETSKANYKTFQQFLRRLLLLVTGPPERYAEKAAELRAQVAASTFLPEKAWLLEKIPSDN